MNYTTFETSQSGAAHLRDPQLRALFERDGVVVVDLLDPHEIASLRELNERVRRFHIHDFMPSLWCHDLGYRREVDAEVSRILAPKLAPLLEGEKICFAGLAVKKPRSKSALPLHQDLTFVDETQYATLGVWVPLVEATPENGSLSVIPRSHLLNRHERGFGGSFPYEAITPWLERRYLLQTRIPAGKAVLFTQRLFHASGPNTSDEERPAAYALITGASAPMRFLHFRAAQEQDPFTGTLDVVAVDDDFYRRYLFGTLPSEGERLGSIDFRFEPLDAQRLRAVLGPGRAVPE
ncbi:MAG TPA: phytanoyl-CoA dioxygenase family protein [Haliangium sp.]|nr:phytanoyl-CoA dioxygenase family protein [Haliangium sp.]